MGVENMPSALDHDAVGHRSLAYIEIEESCDLEQHPSRFPLLLIFLTPAFFIVSTILTSNNCVHQSFLACHQKLVGRRVFSISCQQRNHSSNPRHLHHRRRQTGQHLTPFLLLLSLLAPPSPLSLLSLLSLPAVLAVQESLPPQQSHPISNFLKPLLRPQRLETLHQCAPSPKTVWHAKQAAPRWPRPKGLMGAPAPGRLKRIDPRWPDGRSQKPQRTG